MRLDSTSMSSPTFSAWLAHSEDVAAQQDVSGKYGGQCQRILTSTYCMLPISCSPLPCAVDFRTPDASNANRCALRMLRALRDSEPAMVRVNGAQFDYVSRQNTAVLNRPSQFGARVFLVAGGCQRGGRKRV